MNRVNQGGALSAPEVRDRGSGYLPPAFTFAYFLPCDQWGGGGEGGEAGTITVPGDHMLEDVYGPYLLCTNLRKLGKGYRARLDHADRNQPLHPKPFPLSMQRVPARVHIKFVLT